MTKPKTWQEFQSSVQTAIGTMSDENCDDAATLCQAMAALTEGNSNIAIMSALILLSVAIAKRCARENDMDEEIVCHGIGHVLHDAMLTFAPKATMLSPKPKCIN